MNDLMARATLKTSKEKIFLFGPELLQWQILTMH
jgi:hypothetical protein